MLDKAQFAGQLVKWPPEKWYQVFTGLTIVINMFCMVGLWKMKKWAAYTYIGWAVVAQAVQLIVGSWSMGTFIFIGIIAGVILLYVNRMD